MTQLGDIAYYKVNGISYTIDDYLQLYQDFCRAVSENYQLRKEVNNHRHTRRG